jgi:hypothetical protein
MTGTFSDDIQGMVWDRHKLWQIKICEMKGIPLLNIGFPMVI